MSPSTLPLSDQDAAIQSIARGRCKSMMRAFEAGGFGSIEAGRIRVCEIIMSGVNLDEDGVDLEIGKTARCQVNCELEVEPSNCNWGGNMHGGCTAWLIDVATTLPIFCLQGNDRWTTSGVTTSLAVYYHAGAPLGMKLRVVSNVVMQGKLTAVLEARIEDRETGKIIATATHQKADVPHGKLDVTKLFAEPKL